MADREHVDASFHLVGARMGWPTQTISGAVGHGASDTSWSLGQGSARSHTSHQLASYAQFWVGRLANSEEFWE